MDFVAQLKEETHKELDFLCFEIFATQYCEFRETVEKHRLKIKQNGDCDYAESLKLMQILHSHLEHLQIKTVFFARNCGIMFDYYFLTDWNGLCAILLNNSTVHAFIFAFYLL